MQEDSRREAYFAHWPSPAKPSASAAAACPPARARYGVRRFCHRPIYILLWQTRRTLRTLNPTLGRPLRPCLLVWSGMAAQRSPIASLAWRQLASGTRLATQVLNQRDAWDLRDAVCPSNTIRYDVCAEYYPILSSTIKSAPLVAKALLTASKTSYKLSSSSISLFTH